VGDEKRKVLNAAKKKVSASEKKSDGAKKIYKSKTNEYNDLVDIAKGVQANLKKKYAYVKVTQKKLIVTKKLIANNSKKIKEIQISMAKKLKLINELKLVFKKQMDKVEGAKDKARAFEEVKEKARKSVQHLITAIKVAKKRLKKAKKISYKLEFAIKNEERIIHSQEKIQETIEALSTAENTLDKNPKQSMKRDIKLTQKKFRVAEKRFKNAEKLLAAEVKTVAIAKKAYEEVQNLKDSKTKGDKQKFYNAKTYFEACSVRLEFATSFKQKLYTAYVDMDNNWLIDQNIMEFDKKSRQKEKALMKAYENPKDYDVQEAEEKFKAYRVKYIAELKKKVDKKSKDIK